MTMEKNGNTFAPGDTVGVRQDPNADTKTAGKMHGKVLNVDVDRQLVHVKWASADAEQWLSFDVLEKR